jgi:nucleoid-associated protein YgaU
MDVRTGVSFALSFLCVGVAAVALYRPEPVRELQPPVNGGALGPGAGPGTVVDAVAEPQPRSAQNPPRGSGVDQAVWGEPVRSPAANAKSAVPRTMLASDRNGAAVSGSARPAGAVAERSVRAAPRSAFTTVEPGESLSAVALRVYGSLDVARDLWRANRDQIARPDDPLAPGTILRTP